MEIDDTAPAVTVKFESELADWLATVTLIGPLCAPLGTVTVKLVGVAALTAAVVPLNCTVFDEGLLLKPWP